MNKPPEVPFSPLIADILTAQSEFTRQITDSVVDGLTEDLARTRATLAAVRRGVVSLIDGDVMPTPRAIEGALWPSEALIAEFRRAEGSA